MRTDAEGTSRVGGVRTGSVVAATTARRAARSGAVWGALFGVLVMNEALSYHQNFPTSASREQFAATMGANTGLAAIIGPARQVDTIEGFVAWRVFGLLIIVGAVWGLLTSTRLLRGEEDAGRWELLLSGRTDRRGATVQGLAGLATGFAVLWTITAVLAVVAGTRPSVGFSVSSSLFYATATTAGAALFLAVGALTSQLAPTRRQANGLAAAVFGLAFLVRMVADSGGGRDWLRWASPLGWIENLSPLTGSRPLALVPLVVVIAGTGGAAALLAGRRDVGTGILARSGPSPANTRLLGTPTMLAVRLERWVVSSWVVGLAVLGLIFGVTARSATEGNVAVEDIEETVGRLGGSQGGVAAWIGYEFLYLAAIVAFAAAGQVSALRREESDGHLDNLLARPVGRAGWLAGRLVVAAVLVVGAGLAAGIGGWVGLTNEVGLPAMLRAGLNTAVPGLLVLGVGTLLYGLAPRFAAPILYAAILWSFLVETIGTSITSNRWLLDTAVFSHLGPVPAAEVNWAAVGALLGLGVATGLAGLLAFERRDLAGA